LKTTHVQYLEVGLLSKIPLLLAIQQFGTCERKIQGVWTLIMESYGPVLVHSTMHPPSSLHEIEALEYKLDDIIGRKA
jgi:hypothetical protein